MADELARLPLAEADRIAREHIENHRDEMGRWRRLRAERIAAERATGTPVADIAETIGVHVDVVYKLLRLARTGDEA